MVRANVCGGSPVERSETTGVGFVKAGSEREAVIDVQSGESEEEEVMGKE